MGRLHLKYLFDDQYYACQTCSTHIAATSYDFHDNLILGGVSRHIKIREL